MLVLLRDERVEVGAVCVDMGEFLRAGRGPRGAAGRADARRTGRGRQTATASWPDSCASEISSSERRMAPLMRCHALPVLQDSLEVAGAVVAAALGDRDRALDRVDDRGGADRGCRAGELVAAVASRASEVTQAGAMEALQQLADRRQPEPRALGDLGRRAVGGPGAAARQARIDRAVVGEFADA